jgi:hypothetical protein
MSLFELVIVGGDIQSARNPKTAPPATEGITEGFFSS